MQQKVKINLAKILINTCNGFEQSNQHAHRHTDTHTHIDSFSTSCE